MREGLISFEIPVIEYAVFTIRPRNLFSWGMVIREKGAGFEIPGRFKDEEVTVTIY